MKAPTGLKNRPGGAGGSQRSPLNGSAERFFTSVPQLERAIHDYTEHNNPDPKPFVWTKSTNEIIRKVNRGRAALKMPPLPHHAQF
jgi:hypothetical protein